MFRVLARSFVWLGGLILAELCESLAKFWRTFGRLPEAEPLLRQAAELRRRVQGEVSPDFLSVVNQTAVVQLGQGKHVQAEALFTRLIDLAGRAGEAGRSDLVRARLNLGFLYVLLGRFDEGEQQYRQARTAAVQLGQSHEHFLVALELLGELHLRRGDTKSAAPLLRKTAEIRDSLIGLRPSRGGWLARLWPAASGLLSESHLSRANSLRALAWLDRLEGRLDEAARRLDEALVTLRRANARGEMSYSQILGELGQLRLQTGRYAEAEAAFREAVGRDPLGLGERRPAYDSQLRDLAMAVAGCGRLVEARDLMARVISLQDQSLDEAFALANEEKQLLYLGKLAGDLDVYLSLVLATQTPAAVRNAFEVVFRRKGLAAEVLNARRDAVLARRPELRPRLEELARLRERLAELLLAGPGLAGVLTHRQEVLDLRAKKDSLELALARDVPEAAPGLALRRATLCAAAEQLRLHADGAALAEFIRVRFLNARAGHLAWDSDPRYLAFVLTAEAPDAARLIDLKSAGEIDRWIDDFRRAILTPGWPDRSGARVIDSGPTLDNTPGVQLRQRLVEPLLSALPGHVRWLLAPDAELYRLPFEALPDGNGHLLDRLEISYVAVGREVLRFGGKGPSPRASAVLAAPDFDLSDGAAAPSPNRGGERFCRPQQPFEPLPGTMSEGSDVARILGVVAWTGKAACKSAALALTSPRVLHLATHGFVLPPPGAAGTPGADLTGGRPQDNPLLRAAVALAGVNAWLRGQRTSAAIGNGLLTAEEVTGLDLTGTRLVVLSACETGLGDVTVGEGVFGLRRAFALAGAAAQVISLWQVPDQETAELMAEFYAGLREGLLPPEALRQAQRRLRRREPNPYAWAGFIFQGDPSSAVF